MLAVRIRVIRRIPLMPALALGDLVYLLFPPISFS